MESLHWYVESKEISLFPSAYSESPLIYFFNGEENPEEICSLVSACGIPFHFASISGMNWNKDLSPWQSFPVYKGEEPFGGGADETIRQLTEEIIPSVEKKLPGNVKWRALAGYSLAGVFTLYAGWKTGLFESLASISGSLWFPNFTDYISSHSPILPPKHVYLSLGNREDKVKNSLLRSVRDKTEETRRICTSLGIDSILVIEPGNHFHEPEARVSRGIRWLLERGF